MRAVAGAGWAGRAGQAGGAGQAGKAGRSGWAREETLCSPRPAFPALPARGSQECVLPARPARRICDITGQVVGKAKFDRRADPCSGGKLGCSRGCGRRRCSGSKPVPWTSRSTCRSGCPDFPWSACQTPASGRAATASEARSAIPASRFPLTGSPSIWLPPTCERPAPRSTCRLPLACSPRRASSNGARSPI
jgi:hypothetical protein